MAYQQGVFPIISAQQLNATVYSMWIACPQLAAQAKVGQFVHILCGEKTLRRPISICEISKENGALRIVFEIRGEGTEWLAGRKAGDELDILGPLGNGFTLCDCEKAIFVGGGIGVPPLLEGCKAYGVKATAILGFRNKDAVILERDFTDVCDNVYVTTDDGSYGTKGFVTDVLKDCIEQGAAVFACGPKPMLKGVAMLAKEAGAECQVSLEERMGCGIGACLVCACKTKEKDGEHMRHVCKNGPVFPAEEVVW